MKQVTPDADVHEYHSYLGFKEKKILGWEDFKIYIY